MVKKTNHPKPSNNQNQNQQTTQPQTISKNLSTKTLFFNNNKNNHQFKNKSNVNQNQMLQEVQIQNQFNQQNQTTTIKGKINYQWFSLAFSKIIPANQQQQIAKYQQLIQKRLGQIDQVIKNKERRWQRQVFGKPIWVITDNQFQTVNMQSNIIEPLSLEASNSKDIEELNVLRKILCYMNESRARQLIIDCKMSQILLMFSHVQFKNLKNLYIHGQIESLEPLQWMDCPNLGNLVIRATLITNSKCLSKLYTSKLHTFLIHKNKFPNLQLSRIKMKRGSKLSAIEFFHDSGQRSLYNREEEIALQDLGQAAKAEAGWSQISHRQKLLKNRIRQKWIDKLYDERGWGNMGVIEYDDDSKSQKDQN